MTLSPDDDFAAAEFALGTLDPGERATLAARRLREPELDAAIRAWEARLSPLADATTPIDAAARPFRRRSKRASRRRRRRLSPSDNVADLAAPPDALARGGGRGDRPGGDAGGRRRRARSDASGEPA